MSNEHLLKKLEEVREVAGKEANIELSPLLDNYVVEVFPNDIGTNGPYRQEGNKDETLDKLKSWYQ